MVPAHCLSWDTHWALSQLTGIFIISPLSLVCHAAANGRLHGLKHNCRLNKLNVIYQQCLHIIHFKLKLSSQSSQFKHHNVNFNVNESFNLIHWSIYLLHRWHQLLNILIGEINTKNTSLILYHPPYIRAHFHLPTSFITIWWGCDTTFFLCSLYLQKQKDQSSFFADPISHFVRISLYNLYLTL